MRIILELRLEDLERTLHLDVIGTENTVCQELKVIGDEIHFVIRNSVPIVPSGKETY